MADVVKIKNLDRLAKKLGKLQAEMKAKTAKRVVVGYTASYALAVHENVEMKWKGLPRDPALRGDASGRVRSKKTGRFSKVGKRGRYWDPQGRGQAKFLEEPARRLRGELGRIVATVMAKTKGNAQKALLAAGLRLQRESQQVVPVDTGNLKSSAFTRVEYKSL